MARDLALLAARVMLAWMFLASAVTIFSNPVGASAYFAGLGLPFPAVTAWAVGMFEMLAGAMLVIGFLARPAAAALAFFAVMASLIGHWGHGDTPQLAFLHQQAFMKDIAAAGGLIVLALHGAGRISVDRRLLS
jgi:putative oxidoreductase